MNGTSSFDRVEYFYRYYGTDEDEDKARPHIDLCYKVVKVKKCKEEEIEVRFHRKMKS